jgi:Ca2+-binding RTX toxin-like protein
MGRLWAWLLVVCALAALVAPAAGAAESPAEAEPTPAEVAAEMPTPSCAEGPLRDGDVIVGTDCADTIVVPPNVAYVNGGPGNDTILATGPSTSALTCTTSHCGVGSQEFVGGSGNDTVFGERGNDILRGGEGNDRLYGGIGDDRLEGGPGNDLLSGGFGADAIDGGEGSDFVRGDATIDKIVDTGAAGDIDTLSYATGATPGFGNKPPYGDLPPYPEFSKKHPGFPAGADGRGVYLDLSGTTHGNGFDGGAPSGGGADDVAGADFERIIGTPFADYIVGAKAGQQIYGGGGGDVLIASSARGELFGGADGDDCVGGTPAPSCESTATEGPTSRVEATKVEVGEMVEGATDQAELYLVGPESGTVAEAITVTAAGTAPSETVTFARSGGAEFATPAVGSGCRSVNGNEVTCAPGVPVDSVTVAGLGGADKLTATNLEETTALVLLGGEGNDELVGGELSDDSLVDGPGNDVLRGGRGDDGLVDGPGADEIFGEEGNDLLIATALCEGDLLEGGEGRDNASWAKLAQPSGLGVDARLDVDKAGQIGAGDQVECPGGTPDTLAGIEDLEGSPRSDVLVGDAGPNQLLGHQGEDSYFAGAGEDSILANSKSRDAVINCGADTDTAIVDLPAIGDPAPIECETVNGEPPGEYEEPPVLLPPTSEPAPPSTPAPETSAPPVGSTTSPGTTTMPGGAKPGGPANPKPDRTPPRTKLLGHPAKVLHARGQRAAVAIRFAASERSHFECKLDARAFHSCRSPFRARLAAGRHAFRVYAIDAAGNRDRTPSLLHLRVVAARPR